VKQQLFESEQFIVIKDKLQRLARDFKSNGKKGKESTIAERPKERESVSV